MRKLWTEAVKKMWLSWCLHRSSLFIVIIVRSTFIAFFFFFFHYRIMKYTNWIYIHNISSQFKYLILKGLGLQRTLSSWRMKAVSTSFSSLFYIHYTDDNITVLTSNAIYEHMWMDLCLTNRALCLLFSNHHHLLTCAQIFKADFSSSFTRDLYWSMHDGINKWAGVVVVTAVHTALENFIIFHRGVVVGATVTSFTIIAILRERVKKNFNF